MADKDTVKVVNTVLHDVLLDQTQESIREDMTESVRSNPAADKGLPKTKGAEKTKMRGNLRLVN